jgi:hypothetical protein
VSATTFMWLVTMPSGEDRVVPLMGSRLVVFWDIHEAMIFLPMVQDYAANAKHGPYPYRLARLVEQEAMVQG